MYTLYYSPGAASMAVHQTLIEIGASHELRLVDLDAREHKSDAYLKLNPAGVVPTLIIDGAPVSECAALLLLLAERHPDAGLAPAPGSPARAVFLQWMLHLANTLQPAFRQWFYPGDFAASEDDSREHARWRIEAGWDRLDAHLAVQGPAILGVGISMADLYATMLMRWSRNMPRPATDWPRLATLVADVKRRPSWRRLYEIEGLSEWS